MDTNKKDLIKKTLQAAQNRFTRQLPEKLAEIERGWVGLPDRSFETKRFRLLYRQVHNLAGSAGTFDLPDVGNAAREIEKLLKPLLKGEKKLPTDAQKQLPERLDHLRQVCEDAQKKQTSETDTTTSTISSQRQAFMQQRPLYLLGVDQPLSKELNRQLGFFGYYTQDLATVENLKKNAQIIPPLAIILDTININRADTNLLETINWKEDVPLIFLTPLQDLNSRLHAVRAGCVACFSKPVNLTRLVDVLDGLQRVVEQEPFRVLIIDDDHFLADFYATILQENSIITQVVTDPMTVLQPLETFAPDLILMDLYMPGCSGFELARVIRLQESLAATPIIFLSQETDMERILAAMSLGGDDFLSKPVQPKHLLLAVNNRIKRSRSLRSALVQDGLTGLLNHTTIKERLVEATKRAEKEDVPMVYAMIGIDRFAVINGAYGYEAGDRVLKSLARLLKRQLRPGDHSGRYGGDRFAVILSNCDANNARRLLEETQNKFSYLEHQYNHISFKASFSWGMALFPEHQDPFTLGNVANQELGKTKKG